MKNRWTRGPLLASVAVLGLAAAPPLVDSHSRPEQMTSPSRLEVRAIPRSLSPRIGTAWTAGFLGDRLFVLDSRDHQIATQEPGQQWSFFGSIGNAPGELFYPTEMALDPETQQVAVFDSGNQRLQVFDAAMQLVAATRIAAKVFGLSWWHQRRLLIGCPETGALLSVYNPSRGPVGAVGELAQPSELSRLDRGVRPTFRTAINRVRITSTGQDEVWVAFIHLPLVRRYNAAGQLMVERTLELEGSEDLAKYARAVWDLTDRPSSAAYLNIDGVQLPLVIKDITTHPGTGEPVLLLGNDRIAVLGRDAQLQVVAEVVGCNSSFHRMTVHGERLILLTSLSKGSLCEVRMADLSPEAPPPADSGGSADP